jgi:hypothetical protein
MVRTYKDARPGNAAMLNEIPMAMEMGARCPGCGLLVEAWRLVDLRGAPAAAQAELRKHGRAVEGYDAMTPLFRCDGCVGGYERNGVTVPDQKALGGRRAMREDLILEWSGADAEIIDRAHDALDLRDARRAAKRGDGVFFEEKFRAQHAPLVARINARGKFREK